jgi:hypothetical protein
MGQTVRTAASATCALHFTAQCSALSDRKKYGESDITSRKEERTKEVAMLTTGSSIPMSRATLSYFPVCSSLSALTTTTTKTGAVELHLAPCAMN